MRKKQFFMLTTRDEIGYSCSSHDKWLQNTWSTVRIFFYINHQIQIQINPKEPLRHPKYRSFTRTRTSNQNKVSILKLFLACVNYWYLKTILCTTQPWATFFLSGRTPISNSTYSQFSMIISVTYYKTFCALRTRSFRAP